MSLAETKKIFQQDASKIEDYNLLSPTELGNGYCDADERNDSSLKSAYWSALMLRYWYKIPRWIVSSKSCNLPADEFVHWLAKALYIAFYYRSWRYEYEAIVKEGKFISWKLDKKGNKIPNEHYWKRDPNAVDRTINFFCATIRGRYYQYMNKDKRKNDGQALSIESVVDENGKQIDCFGQTPILEASGAHELVELLLKANKPLEALIIDGIAYQDSFKYKKECFHRIGIDSQGKEVIKRYSTTSSSFDIRRLVKHLSNIDESFIRDYFCSTYGVKEVEEENILSKILKMTNPKWYKCIQKTFEDIKSNKQLLSCLIDVN